MSSDAPSPQDILNAIEQCAEEHGTVKQSTLNNEYDISNHYIYKHFSSLTEAKLRADVDEVGTIRSDDAEEYFNEDKLLLELERIEEEHGKVTQNIVQEYATIPLSVYEHFFETLSLAKAKADVDSGQIHLTDEQLRQREGEMKRVFQKCKERHGKVSKALVRNMDCVYTPKHYKRHYGTFSEAKRQLLENPKQVHVSESKRKQLNQEIQNNQYKRDILTGLLMGDGWMKYPDDKNPRFGVEMAEKGFLEWVSDNLGEVVREPYKSRDAADLAEKNRRQGYTVNEENYSDLYTLLSVGLPALNEFAEWYDSGQKRFPDWVKLNPTVTKMWYCCDGSLVEAEDGFRYPVIYVANESDREGYLMSLFEETPFSPNLTQGGGGTLQFSRDEAEDFLNWLGDPPAGFEYKWLPEQRPSQ